MVLDYRTQISNYQALKRQVEAAIKDEQEAQKMYGNLINTAMNVTMRYVADQVHRIRDDEIRHEQTFRTIITTIDTAIGAAIKEEAEVKRKKEQEELEKQKKTRFQTFR